MFPLSKIRYNFESTRILCKTCKVNHAIKRILRSKKVIRNKNSGKIKRDMRNRDNKNRREYWQRNGCQY